MSTSKQNSLVDQLREAEDLEEDHIVLRRLMIQAAEEIERLMQSQWGGVESLAKQRNEALERVAELHADVETLQAELAKERAAYSRSFKAVVEVERLRVALRGISHDEIHEMPVFETSEWEDDYWRVVNIARTALASETGVK